MDGLIKMLDAAGRTIAQMKMQIAALERRIEELEAEATPPSKSAPPA